MEKIYFNILFFVCTSLLHFVTPFGQYQYISDCNIEHNIHSTVSGGELHQFHGLTFICGENDNTNKIFGSNSVDCSKRRRSSGIFIPSYASSYHYNRFVKISFENCHFRDINSGYFTNFTQLQSFDVSNIGAEKISIEKYHQLQFLTFFNASHNQLTSFPSNLFKAVKNLVSLDISHNEIRHIVPSDFEGATNVKMLNISHNHLLEIPSNLFKDAKGLLVVDFSANAIDQVWTADFIHTNDMISLDLSNNRLKSIEDHLFDSMPKLKYLNLSYNPIGDLKIDTLAYLTDLEHLDFRQTNISNIVFGTFSFQPKLISLDLSDNKLKRLDFDLFLPVLQHLKSLRLAGNQLQNLNGFINTLFPQLTSLDIKNNKFTCQYLISFMKSIDWNNLDIPVDPNAVDRQKISIRGINCENHGSGGGGDDGGGDDGGEGAIPQSKN